MTTVTDTTKVPKDDAEKEIARLNSFDGVYAEQWTTDEFDIPPSAIIGISVNIEEIPYA